MNCEELLFSDHAIGQMFKRDIEINDVRKIIGEGVVVTEYPNDKPYPSWLLLGFINKRPIHVVVAKAYSEAKCIVITAYQPDTSLWESDFKTKRK